MLSLFSAMDERHSYSLRRTRISKSLLFVLASASLLCMVTISTASVLKNGKPFESMPESTRKFSELRAPAKLARRTVKDLTNREICTTPECVITAGEVLSNMDPTVDPCDDFFQFACGGWIKNNRIPETSAQWGQFDLLGDQLSSNVREILEAPQDSADPKSLNDGKTIYKTCIDTDTLESLGVQPLIDLLIGVGGWPIISSDWTDTEYDWNLVAADAKRRFNLGLLLAPDIYLDDKNTNISVIYIDQSTLTLSRTMLTDPETYATQLAAYKTFIVNVAKELRDSTGSDTTNAEIESDADEIIQFDQDLAQITTPGEERRDSSRLYNPFEIDELQAWVESNATTTNPWAKIQFRPFLERMLQTSTVTLEDNERIIVLETDFLNRLSLLLDRSSVRQIANYLSWRVALVFVTSSTQRLRDISFEFEQVLTGAQAPQSQTKTCSSQVNDYLGFAVSSKYIGPYFDPAGKVEAEAMVADIKAAFKELVSESTWMDAETQVLAQEKVDAMREFIAYPEWLNNNTAVDSFYDVLTVSPTSYLQNVEALRSLVALKSFNTLRGTTDRDEWEIWPTIVNAMYDPKINSINFPAGILQSPFFSPSRPASLNYGGIGVVIGHEITHGFDDQGRQSDKFGNSVQWWSDATIEAYNEHAQCFIDQYTNYTVPELVPILGDDAHLNGVNTQGENIADNGGIREAFRAYMRYVADNGPEPRLPGLEDLSPEQLVFIGHASVWCNKFTDEALLGQVLSNVHSPAKYRVWGPVSNSEDFAREWNCPPGSPMNRADKCVLW